MPAFIDLVGKIFGRLTVLKYISKDKWGSSRWLCKCDCGKEKIIQGDHLRSKATQSCGCLKMERILQANTKHGHYKNGKESQIHKIWNGIIQRCTNPKNSSYKYYGGRGIIVCKEWLKFENFLEDMNEPPTKKHTLDRIDNDGNYCKENCRWATRQQQARNRRNNRLETFNGKTQYLMEWAKEYNILCDTLWTRLYRLHWSIEKALITPVRKCKFKEK